MSSNATPHELSPFESDVALRIGANVRLEMTRAGRQQQELAEWLTMDPSLLSRRINGKTMFRVSELLTLSSRLGVPLDRFLVGL